MKVKVSYSPSVSEINEVDLTIETTTRGEWLIGRSPDSDLVLDSPDVSRLHAKFSVKSGNYYFIDLGSRNGSIFNGKQAEKDRLYILSDGDIIRIADYVLIMEAVVSEQLPETVFRIIDPSLFSRSRSPENFSTSNVANPAPEVVREVPAPISNEVETPEINPVSPEISKISEVPSTKSDDIIPVAEVTSPENIIQPPEAVNEVPHDARDEIVDLRTLVVEEEVSPEVGEVEIPEASEAEPDEAIKADETISEVPETWTVPNNNAPEVFSNQYIDLTETTTAEVRGDVDNVSAEVSEVSDLVDIQSLEPTESKTSEIVSQNVVEISEIETTESDEIDQEIEAIESDEIDQEINVTKPPETVVERNIVVIAHESKKSELAEFVAQHQKFFSQSFTITWPSVSEVLHQQAGITVSQQTPAPTSGGYQTIASLVGSGEILAVIFLRDLLQPQPGQANEEALLRLCNINQVLLATNLPTAEAIVHYLKHVVD
jgi:methylglyoxal synthase